MTHGIQRKAIALALALLASIVLASDKRIGQIVSAGASTCLGGLQPSTHYALQGPGAYYYRTGNATAQTVTAVNTDPTVQANALFDTWTLSDENTICILPVSGSALTVQVNTVNPP